MNAPPTSRDETDVLLSIRGRIWRDTFHPSEWYVGISPDPERDLFQRHGVRRNDAWTYELARTAEEAARIADYLTAALGADGVPRRDLTGPAYVYAYRKAPHTHG